MVTLGVGELLVADVAARCRTARRDDPAAAALLAAVADYTAARVRAIDGAAGVTIDVTITVTPLPDEPPPAAEAVSENDDDDEAAHIIALPTYRDTASDQKRKHA